MPTRARAVRSGVANHKDDVRGADIRPVSQMIIMRQPPAHELCTWVPAASWPLGPGFVGWRLKFRHGACPARIRGEHE